MLDVTQLDQIDINKKKTFSEIQEKVADIMLHSDGKEARILSRFLNEQLAKNKSIYETEYQKIVSQLKFFDLIFLSDNEIIGLYQNDFGKILEYYEEYEPFLWLRLVLLNKSIEERDVFKKRVSLALLANKELITNRALFFTAGGESQPPSITNWIKDYAKIAGGGAFSNLAKANYFIKSKNYLKLNEEEKNKVKVLLKFYFRLQISSATPKGFENDIVFTDKDGKTKILSGGEIIDPQRIAMTDRGLGGSKKATKVEEIIQATGGDKKLTKDLQETGLRANLNVIKTGGNQSKKKDIAGIAQKTTKQLMRKILIGNQKEEKEIKDMEAEIRTVEGGKIDKIIVDLQKNIQDKQIKEVVARLRLLARQGSKSLVRLLEPAATELTPLNFQKLLKNILSEKLGLAEPEVARYAMQLAMILKKKGQSEFMPTVYFDKQSGEFRWNI